MKTFRGRLIIIGVTWGIALIACNPCAIAALPLFPVGLLVNLGLLRNGGEDESALLGWLFYAVLTCILVATSKRIFFWIAYLIFIVLLVLNVHGCHGIQHDMSQMH